MALFSVVARTALSVTTSRNWIINVYQDEAAMMIYISDGQKSLVNHFFPIFILRSPQFFLSSKWTKMTIRFRMPRTVSILSNKECWWGGRTCIAKEVKILFARIIDEEFQMHWAWLALNTSVVFAFRIHDCHWIKLNCVSLQIVWRKYLLDICRFMWTIWSRSFINFVKRSALFDADESSLCSLSLFSGTSDWNGLYLHIY